VQIEGGDAQVELEPDGGDLAVGRISGGHRGGGVVARTIGLDAALEDRGQACVLTHELVGGGREAERSRDVVGGRRDAADLGQGIEEPIPGGGSEDHRAQAAARAEIGARLVASVEHGAGGLRTRSHRPVHLLGRQPLISGEA
jgi:hypothetical protein